MQEWDASAAEYDRFEQRWHHYRNVAAGLLSYLDPKVYPRILELACGTGACTGLLAETNKNAEIVAVERSEGMLHFAKRNLPESLKMKVSFVKADATGLPLNFQREFDLAICNSAFWQFDDALKVLEDLRLLLRREGLFAFSPPLWFLSDETRDPFRKEVKEIYAKYGLVPRGSGRTSFEYRKFLETARYDLVRDETYEVDLPGRGKKGMALYPGFPASLSSPH